MTQINPSRASHQSVHKMAAGDSKRLTFPPALGRLAEGSALWRQRAVGSPTSTRLYVTPKTIGAPFALLMVFTECGSAIAQGGTNMNAPNHQPCYRRLFPESVRGDAKGKVFSLQYVANLRWARKSPSGCASWRSSTSWWGRRFRSGIPLRKRPFLVHVRFRVRFGLWDGWCRNNDTFRRVAQRAECHRGLFPVDVLAHGERSQVLVASFE